jgi:hypothetical protein
MEELKKKFLERYREEQKSDDRGRHLVNEFMFELLEDSGQIDEMLAQLRNVMVAADRWVSWFEENRPPDDDPEMKTFRVEFWARFYSGMVRIRALSAEAAKEEVENEFDGFDLNRHTQDVSIEIERVYEIDANGVEIPGTGIEGDG